MPSAVLSRCHYTNSEVRTRNHDVTKRRYWLVITRQAISGQIRAENERNFRKQDAIGL